MKESRSIGRIRSALHKKGFTLHRARWEPCRWTDCGDIIGGWSIHVRPVADVIVALNLNDALWQIREMPHASELAA